MGPMDYIFGSLGRLCKGAERGKWELIRKKFVLTFYDNVELSITKGKGSQHWELIIPMTDNDGGGDASSSNLSRDRKIVGKRRSEDVGEMHSEFSFYFPAAAVCCFTFRSDHGLTKFRYVSTMTVMLRCLIIACLLYNMINRRPLCLLIHAFEMLYMTSSRSSSSSSSSSSISGLTSPSSLTPFLTLSPFSPPFQASSLQTGLSCQ